MEQTYFIPKRNNFVSDLLRILSVILGFFFCIWIISKFSPLGGHDSSAALAFILVAFLAAIFSIIKILVKMTRKARANHPWLLYVNAEGMQKTPEPEENSRQIIARMFAKTVANRIPDSKKYGPSSSIRWRDIQDVRYFFGFEGVHILEKNGMSWISIPYNTCDIDDLLKEISNRIYGMSYMECANKQEHHISWNTYLYF